MIKKISAIVLALVLCLSVVVVPVSAVELGSAKQAFEVKFDKEYYNAGDTAIVSVYAKVAEGYEIGASYIVIGLNSAVFSQSENSTTDIKASLVTNSVGAAHFKDPATFSTVAWAPNAQVTAITGSNTADENALYNQYLKVSLNKSTEDGTGTKNGFPSEDLNADEDPIIQLELKVAEGLADGTPINAAVTTGAISKGLAYMAYYSNPGNATSTAKFAVADSVTTAATATVGTPFEFPTFTIGAGKDAIRFEKNADKSYANKVTIRTMAKIAAADLQDATGVTANDDIEAKIKSVGFVYAPSTTEFNAADAQAVAQGGTVAGYVKQPVSYIQYDGTSYNFTCLVEVQDADVASANFNTYAYIELDFGANGTKYYFSAEKDAISAQALYSANKDAAWEKYGW